MSQAVENTPFWLKDNFAPVFEETTAENLSIRGTIPSALNGRLLRNGANPQTGSRSIGSSAAGCCMVSKSLTDRLTGIATVT